MLPIASNSEEPPSKKRCSPLISKAKSCGECRRLKLKCNRCFPCENCKRRGTEGICPDGSLKTIRGRKMVLDSAETLHERIEALEKALQAASSKDHPLLREAYHLENNDDELDGDHEDHANTHAGPSAVPVVSGKSGPEISVGAESTDDSDRSDDTEGENGRSHLRIDPSRPGASRFYGDASSLFLIEEESPGGAIGAQTSPAALPFRPGWIQSFMFEKGSALEAERCLEDVIRCLPPLSEAHRMADSYFQNVAWGTAIISQTSFTQETLLPCYHPQYPRDPQRFAVLYLILAVGALFDLNLPEGAMENNYTRDLVALGRACLSLDSSGTLLFVQAIHILVNWLSNAGQLVSSSHATWPLLGMAMRTVQAMGLHRDGEQFGLPPAAVEERRRVFWEIYAYDTTMSLTMGRPRMMNDRTFDVKFPKTPETGDCYPRLIIQTMRSDAKPKYLISRQFARINDEQSKPKPSSYETILKLDRDIRKLQQELPSQLKKGSASTSDGPLTRRRRNVQRLGIQNQLYIGSLFLHRGWFTRALLESPSEPLQSKYSASYVGCLEACKAIINVVSQLAREAPDICHRRWMFLFHAFSACACLAAAVIRAPSSLMAYSTLQALQAGVEIFQQSKKTEELARLIRLKDDAERIFEHAGAPANEEDLAMIGRISKRKSSVLVEVPGEVVQSRPGPESGADFNISGQPLTGDADMARFMGLIGSEEVPVGKTVDTFDFAASFAPTASVTIAEQPVEGYHLTQPARTLDGLHWGDQTMTGTDFDLDAFLTNLGLPQV